MIREAAINRTFDATYSERLRLFESDPEQYFRKYPVKPQCGFQKHGGQRRRPKA